MLACLAPPDPSPPFPPSPFPPSPQIVRCDHQTISGLYSPCVRLYPSRTQPKEVIKGNPLESDIKFPFPRATLRALEE
jgi:hypothetical protein